MKQILIALLLAFTTSTVINAQKQSSIEKDSTENVKVTLSKKTDTKADESNTTVTVIGVDTTAGKDANSVSSSGSSHGKVGFTFESDDNDPVSYTHLTLPTTFPSATSATRSAEGS